LDTNAFAEKLKDVMEYHNFALTHYYGVSALDYDEVLAQALEHAKVVIPMIADAQFAQFFNECRH
jgi:adenylosuccinate synthase